MSSRSDAQKALDSIKLEGDAATSVASVSRALEEPVRKLSLRYGYED